MPTNAIKWQNAYIGNSRAICSQFQVRPFYSQLLIWALLEANLGRVFVSKLLELGEVRLKSQLNATIKGSFKMT